MERGAEPWSWVLETSSAGSPDLSRGEKEAPPPCPTRVPLHRSQCSLPVARDRRRICVFTPKRDLGYKAQLPLPSLPRLQKRPRFPRTYSPLTLCPHPIDPALVQLHFHTRDEASGLSQEPRPQRQEARL